MKRSGLESGIKVVGTLLVILGLVGLVALSVVGLTGCSLDDYGSSDDYGSLDDYYAVSVNSIHTTASYKTRKLADIEENHLFVITDDKTGVQYIVYSEVFGRSGAGGITVRYNADGTPYIDPEWVAEQGEE